MRKGCGVQLTLLDVCRRLKLADSAAVSGGQDLLLRTVSMPTRIARRLGGEWGTGTDEAYCALRNLGGPCHPARTVRGRVREGHHVPPHGGRAAVGPAPLGRARGEGRALACLP